MSIQVSSVKEYFDRLDERFVSGAAKGVEAVVRYELAGDAGGTFTVCVNDGAMEVKQDADDAPAATIRMMDSDFIDMVNGKLNGQMAYMQGKLKVTGNIPIMMKIQAIFPPAK